MDDDFNTGGAVGVLFDLRKTLNAFIGDHKLDTAAADKSKFPALTAGMTLLKELASILGVFREAKAKAASADDGLLDGLMQLVIQFEPTPARTKTLPSPISFATNSTNSRSRWKTARIRRCGDEDEWRQIRSPLKTRERISRTCRGFAVQIISGRQSLS